MKTIHLIRHAKSSWEDSRLTDVNRPLASRGLNDCKIMAPKILEAGWQPVNIYCSTAKRAQMTIRGIADAASQRKISWLIDEALYTFSYTNLIQWLKQLDEEMNEVTMIGHNPAFTELTNKLSGYGLDNVSTCGYVQLRSDADLWLDLPTSNTELCCFLKPKMFK